MSQTTTQTRERPAMALPTLPPAEVKALAKKVAREAGGSNVAAYFEAQKGGIQKLLPAHMTPDRFLRVTLNALRTTPTLMDCTLESLFGATIFCAQMGLEPNTPQGHIYLIPFKNNRKGITEVQVIVGYQGLIALARRTGEIASISAQAVYQHDDYDIDYLNPEQSRHKPKLNGPRGEFIGAWAKATFKDGGMAFDFMPRGDIDTIRDGSQGYRTAKRFNNDRSPWITNYDQMAVKTAIRRLAKRLPMSIEMASAIALDERGDQRQSQRFDRILDAGEFDLSVISARPEDDDGGPADGDESAEQPQQQQQQEQPPPARERAPRQPRGSGQARQQEPAQAEEAARAEAAEGSDGSEGAAGDDAGDGRFAGDPGRGDDPPPPQQQTTTTTAGPAKGAGLNFD